MKMGEGEDDGWETEDGEEGEEVGGAHAVVDGVGDAKGKGKGKGKAEEEGGRKEAAVEA